MATKNTAKSTVNIVNSPTQGYQRVIVKPNGNTMIIEANKNVVPVTTVKETIKYDAAGKPIASVVTTSTAKDVTTPVTRTIINKDGKVIAKRVVIHKTNNVTVTKTVTPYSSPDYTTTTPVLNVDTGTATQVDQVRSYPNIDNTGQIEPAVDTTGVTYVSVGSVASTGNGSIIGQTFRAPKDGILTKIKARVADLGSAGDIICYICDTRDDGAPDMAQVMATTTVAFADLTTGWLSFSNEPIYTTKGGLYAAVFVSTGAHTLETSIGGKYSQGTFFTCTDGAWFHGNSDEDIGIQVYYAEFPNLQTITTMNPLDLQGGIGGVQFKFYEVAPEGANRVIQGQINGVWSDLASDNSAYPFANLPAQVLLRQVISGTKDLMPLTNHDISKSTTFRSRGDFVGVSKLITTGAGVTSITVTARLLRYVEANHNCVIKVMKSDDTQVTAGAVSDTPTDDPLIIERTATFTVASLTTFRIRVEGTTDSVLNTFGVQELLYEAA